MKKVRTGAGAGTGADGAAKPTGSVAPAAAALRPVLRRAATRLSVLLAATDDGAAAVAGAGRLGAPDWWPPTLRVLAAAFGLSRFEAELLLLCAGVEFDPEIGRAIALLHGESGRIAPTFSLAFTQMEAPHAGACLEDAPLRHWRLIDVGPGDGLIASPLRVDPRILGFLLGVASFDQRLNGLVDWRPASEAGEAPPRWQRLAADIVADWQALAATPTAYPCRAALHGRHRGSAVAVARLVAAGLGSNLALVHCDALPAGAGDLAAFRILLERELVLHVGIAALDFFACDDGGDGSAEVADAELRAARSARAGERLLDELALPALALSRRVRLPGAMPTTIATLEPATEAECRAVWRGALADDAAVDAADLDRLAADFRLEPPDIHAVVRAVRSALAIAPVEERRRILWARCRERVRGRLDGLAVRVDRGDPHELVLPTDELRALDQIIAIMRQRARLPPVPGGRASSACIALFSGPSGTGKTLAASAVGRALDLDVYRVDLSSVMSKYIGETERNLRRLFDAAEAGGVVLLFDEADALFGKRSEVRDSHDRYANIQIDYLLQRLDGFAGLAILTTNMPAALDRAFARRIQFAVSFPHPDAAAREAIWRLFLPPGEAGVDPHKLARLSLAGGHIRNIAFAARCLALDRNEPLAMQHLLVAARTECVKLGRPLIASETGDWLC